MTKPHNNQSNLLINQFVMFKLKKQSVDFEKLITSLGITKFLKIMFSTITLYISNHICLFGKQNCFILINKFFSFCHSFLTVFSLVIFLLIQSDHLYQRVSFFFFLSSIFPRVIHFICNSFWPSTNLFFPDSYKSRYDFSPTLIIKLFIFFNVQITKKEKQKTYCITGVARLSHCLFFYAQVQMCHYFR